MHKLSTFVLSVYGLIFSGFNGIQVFIAPMSLLYFIQSHSILTALTSLFSFRMYFSPLLVFLILLLFMVFMIIKVKYFHDGSTKGYYEQFAQINVSILAFIIIAFIFYAISAFMAYFYGIKGIIKPSLAILFKLFAASLVFYHYLGYVWMQPYYKRGYGANRSVRALKYWSRNNKLLFIRMNTLMAVIILASIRVYQLVLSYVFLPLIESVQTYSGIDLRLSFVPFYKIADIYVNVMILFLAFLLSNLLFSPFVLVIHSVLTKLNPIRTRIGS